MKGLDTKKMAWNECLSRVETKERKKWKLGHFRLMLTSKLATATGGGALNQ